MLYSRQLSIAFAHYPKTAGHSMVKWFRATFPDAASIQADPAEFSRRTMQTLYRLRVRMKREDEELYPLVEEAALL